MTDEVRENWQMFIRIIWFTSMTQEKINTLLYTHAFTPACFSTLLGLASQVSLADFYYFQSVNDLSTLATICRNGGEPGWKRYMYVYFYCIQPCRSIVVATATLCDWLILFLFYNTLSTVQLMQSKCQYICECWIRWKIYGSNHTLQNFPEETEKNDKVF